MQGKVYSQTLPVGYPIVEEYSRRSQLFSNIDSLSISFRPKNQIVSITSKDHLKLLPALFTTQSNTNRPYGWDDYGIIPNRRIQEFSSVGITGKYKFINFQFNPEISIAQNKNYQGFSLDLPKFIISSKFLYLNVGDSPERFGKGTYKI